MSDGAQPPPLVLARDVGYTYRSPRGDVEALRGVDLSVRSREVFGILGPTGSGKTTLIKLLWGALAPTRGSLLVAGHDLARLSVSQRQAYRRQIAGCAWQDPSTAFWPELTALEQVQVPMLAGGGDGARARRARRLLEDMRLGGVANADPTASGTVVQRRLALAIALANSPPLLLCDEPTADLDRAAARTLADDLIGTLRRMGATAVIATHDPGLESRLDRAIRLRPRDG